MGASTERRRLAAIMFTDTVGDTALAEHTERGFPNLVTTIDVGK